MLNAIWIGLFLPLVGFLILTATSKWIPRLITGIIASGTLLLSFICFAAILFAYTYLDMAPQCITLYSWIPIKDINADVSLCIDPLSLLMALIITGIGFLIHVYSIGYMDHEEDYARFFACMNLFVFSMLLLVLAGHLLVLFVGWEGVGLASYLLIGFWYHRPTAAQAATKAFIVNRIGDLGFLLGLFLIFQTFGTGDVITIAKGSAQHPVGDLTLTIATLLLFVGATGKSAQIPLQTWLADAMEGPTPVSALIHAATMVTAGVYLVVRMHQLFLQTPFTLYVIGVIGAATALYAALSALAQTDLKRVLAYSTMSQLGLMFLACGIGSFYAAMFHLTTHAFVKALLFLSAGNVVHMMHGITNMEKMGGLKKIFPKTHLLFLIGVLAMSGVPPLAAFFSKDLILEQEYETGHKVLFLVALVVTVLTAFYLTRAYFLTFRGRQHVDQRTLKMVHEAPNIMIIPTALLGLLSIFGGFLGFAWGEPPEFEDFLAEADVTLAHREVSTGFHFTYEMWYSVAAAFFGIGLAALIYTKYRDRLWKSIPILKKAFYFDEIYGAVIVWPLKLISRFVSSILEPKVFDGSINTLAEATNGVAGKLQEIQSGQIRSYAAWMAIGAVLLIVYIIL